MSNKKEPNENSTYSKVFCIGRVFYINEVFCISKVFGISKGRSALARHLPALPSMHKRNRCLFFWTRHFLIL